jgi:hypothetical protein
MQASDFSRIEGVVVKTETRSVGSSSFSLFSGSSAFTTTTNVDALVVWIELDDGQEHPIVLPDSGFLCREGNQIALGLFRGIPIVGINYTTRTKQLITSIRRFLPNARPKNLNFDSSEMLMAIGGVALFGIVLAVLGIEFVIRLVLGAILIAFFGILAAVIRERLRAGSKLSDSKAQAEHEITRYVNYFQ